MTSQSDDSAHDSGHESEHQPQKKFTRRGMTVKKNIINRGNKGLPKLIVQWNAKNQAIGANGKQLKMFLGVRARQDVPITISSWISKKEALLEKHKDELWHMIQKYFDVDDSHKDYCLMKAGKAHRKYRSTLTKMVRDDDGNIRSHPPPPYADSIPLEDWRAFVISREEEEFRRRSQENRERAQRPEYPWRAGVTGYAEIEERMLREQGKDPAQESIDRDVLWLEARQNKDGVVDHPRTREVAQRIESISQSVSQGDISNCDGPNDILARALAIEEYPGRVRGLGFGITPTTFWTSKRQKKEAERESREKRLEATVSMLVQELKELKDRVGPRTNDVPSPDPDSFRDSCNIASNEVNNCQCELFISNPLTLVAKGFVCNTEGSTLHNLPMPSNHVRVSVQFVVVPDAELPVPIDTADMTLLTVNDALGTFVAWPSNLINVPRSKKQVSSRDGNQSQPRKKQVSRGVCSGNEIRSQPPLSSARNKSVSRQVDKGKDIQSQPPSLGEFITYIRIHASTMSGADLIHVSIDEDIFGVADTIFLSNQELEEVYEHKWASAATIQIYIRYLYHVILSTMEQRQRFIFLDPERTFLRNLHIDKKMTKKQLQDVKEAVKESKEAIKAYINTRLASALESSCDCWFLAPINLGGVHWVLLVIDARRNRIFYLDSCHGDYSKHAMMRGMFESCLATFWASNEVRTRGGNNKTNWIVIKCPRQPNNVDCGYYVMKYMKDIITDIQMEIPLNYFPGHEVGAPFSDDILTEVKGEWCHYVASLINQNRNSSHFG